MPDEEILLWASKWDYAQLVVSSSLVIRHGQEQWATILPTLSQEERNSLLERIQRWNELASIDYGEAS